MYVIYEIAKLAYFESLEINIKCLEQRVLYQ